MHSECGSSLSRQQCPPGIRIFPALKILSRATLAWREQSAFQGRHPCPNREFAAATCSRPSPPPRNPDVVRESSPIRFGSLLRRAGFWARNNRRNREARAFPDEKPVL